MKDFLEVVCQGVTHTHPRVRSAALFAMGQFCEHLQVNVQLKEISCLNIICEKVLCLRVNMNCYLVLRINIEQKKFTKD